MVTFKYMGSETFRLFAAPSFIEGMGRALDIGATLEVYNENTTAEEADAKSILSDWKAVGKDLLVSIKKYEYEHGRS
jgi:hypothetical protein